MKTRISAKRLISMLLCVVMLFTVLPAAAYAEPTSSDDDYVEGVIDRLDDYFAHEPLHAWLISNDNFVYCRFQEELENMSNPEKVFLWATRYLTDNQLDEDAYIKYLSVIMALMQKGLVDTTAEQAEYDTEAAGLADYLDYAVTSVSSLVDFSSITLLKEAVSALNLGIDMAEFENKTVESKEQAAVIQTYNDIYEQQMLVLETIEWNTDDDELLKACDYMRQACSVQLVYVVTVLDHEKLDALDIVKGAYDCVNGCIRPDAESILEKVGGYVQNNLAGWIEDKLPTINIAGVTVKAGSAAAGCLKAAGSFVSALDLIKTGFDIGGGICNVLWGEEIRYYREVEALYNIANALADGSEDCLSSAVRDAKNTNLSDSARYEAAFKMVTIGEALCNVRYRGEYCYKTCCGLGMLKNDTPQLEELYEKTGKMIDREYNKLAAIFPEPPEQVIVFSEEVTESGNGYSNGLAMPTVTIPDDPEVTKKINSDEAFDILQELYDRNAADVVETTASVAEEYRYSDYFFSLELGDAYCAGNALSLRMGWSLYEGGVHPFAGKCSMTYDITTGERLSFDDLLNPDDPDSDEQLRILMIQALASACASTGGWGAVFTDYDAAINSVINGSEAPDEDYFSVRGLWYFSKEGLTLAFVPSYELSSVGAGTLYATVSYDEAEPYLSPDYIPQQQKASTAEMKMLDYSKFSDSDLKKYNVYGADDGFNVLLTEGTVYDVYGGKGFSVHYSGYPTTLYSDVDFYANYLTEYDLVYFGPFYDNGTYPGGFGLAFRSTENDGADYRHFWYTDLLAKYDLDESSSEFSYDF